MSINGALAPAAAVVAVDVGKTKAAVLVTDAQRHRLLGPLEFLDDRRRCGPGDHARRGRCCRPG